MKGIAGYVFGAIVLLALGGVCLAVSNLERQMMDAQQNISSFRYEGLEDTFDTAEKYFEYGSHLPWMGNGPVNDVRARKAALQYWQRQYQAVVPQQTDPVGTIPPDNVQLQLVVANAVYRAAQQRLTAEKKATDRAAVLDAIKASADGYMTVLRNATRDEIAAYNYEYLVRMRDDIEKRKKTPDMADKNSSPFGGEGGPPDAGSVPDFKILVPLDENDQIGDPGKAAPRERRG